MFTRLGNGLVLVWLSRQSRGNVSNSGEDLFPGVPSNIKHLYPLKVNLALSRTTRLHSFHSSTTNLKCTKLYDYYEYGLENSSQSLTNAARIPRGILVCTLSGSESQSAKKKEVVPGFMYASYKRLIVIIPPCFVEHFITIKLQFFAHKLGP